MQIIPPELPFDRQRYLTDLLYRNEIDQEAIAERAERIKLLLMEPLISMDTSIDL